MDENVKKLLDSSGYCFIKNFDSVEVELIYSVVNECIKVCTSDIDISRMNEYTQRHTCANLIKKHFEDK